MLRLTLAVTLGATAVGCTGSPAPTARSNPTPTTSHSASHRVTGLSVASARWRLPAPRSREVVIASGGRLLVAGGLDGARSTTSTTWLLDPATGRVRNRGSLAVAVHDSTGFRVGGDDIVAAGGNLTTTSDVQLVRPGRTTVVGQLPRPRSDQVSCVAGRTAYLLGGFDGAAELSAVLQTTDGRHFTRVARLRRTVRYAGVACLGNRLFVFGGEHAGIATDLVQMVDLRSRRVRVVGQLPVPLAHEAVFVLGDVMWLVGGRSHEQLQSRVWRWDAAGRRAVAAGRLPYAVADAGCAVDGDAAYLVGGETPDPTSRVVVLRPRTG